MLIKQESKTSDKYGKKPEDRDLNELLDFGIVVIDKPSGPTSHQTSAYVQKILNINKSGHSGTLDPKVTGVLPVALGRATRLAEYLLKSGKQYVCVMHLHKDVQEYEIRKKAEEFIGKITQLPPKRSAVARKKRERNIYSFEILEIRGRDVLFVADVQAGTYIRKLCHDFGEQLGVGAHMAGLRRTRAATFNEKEAISLQTLADIYHLAKEGDEAPIRDAVQSAEKIVEHLKSIVILDSAIHSLTQGSTLKVPGISKLSEDIKKGELVSLMSLKGELVGVATARMSSEEMMGETGVAAKPEKILMSPDVYPRMD